MPVADTGDIIGSVYWFNNYGAKDCDLAECTEYVWSVCVAQQYCICISLFNPTNKIETFKPCHFAIC